MPPRRRRVEKDGKVRAATLALMAAPDTSQIDQGLVLVECGCAIRWWVVPSQVGSTHYWCRQRRKKVKSAG
jgi:hypothetical protein